MSWPVLAPGGGGGGGEGVNIYEATFDTGSLETNASVDIDLTPGFTDGLVESVELTRTSGEATSIAIGQFIDADARTGSVAFNWWFGSGFGTANLDVATGAGEGPLVAAGGSFYAAPMRYKSTDTTCRLTVRNGFSATGQWSVTVKIRELP